MEDEREWRASTVLGAVLLVDSLVSTVAVLAVASMLVMDRWHDHEPVAVSVPVAVHAAENQWAFERMTVIAGKDVFDRCRDESFCPVPVGEGAEPVNAKTQEQHD